MAGYLSDVISTAFSIFKNTYETGLTGTSLNNSISFGAKGYSDYTIHKDPKRKENYIKRHQVNEDWNDLNKAGTWSKYLSWNKPTLQDSIKNMENKFDIKIKRKVKI